LDIKEIKELIALMRKNDLSVFKMENNGVKITLKRGNDFQPVIHHAGPVSLPVALPPAAPAPAGTSEVPSASGAKLHEITSPMVGTFYGSASPDAQPYVRPGQEVEENTVVCIVEAMKVMNEIKAECRGTIVDVVAENGKPVQYGQVIFRVQPN
jgi:acetyl-CoA carboxylase biotin carboxyl carrier protein